MSGRWATRVDVLSYATATEGPAGSNCKHVAMLWRNELSSEQARTRRVGRRPRRRKQHPKVVDTVYLLVFDRLVSLCSR